LVLPQGFNPLPQLVTPTQLITTSGTTLARTTVLSNSSGTQPSALSFAAGTKDVFVTYPSEYAVAATNVGTSGQLLTSNGTGVAPTYQTSTAASKAYAQAMRILAD